MPFVRRIDALSLAKDMATLTVSDKTLTGDALGEIRLEFPSECISVRELLRSRVFQEVSDFNALGRGGPFRGLVTPAHPASAKTRPIDWSQQFERACEAFERQQILILVGDRQVETLDEEFEITPSANVTFLKLTLLTGG